jgi:hypothetical protein
MACVRYIFLKGGKIMPGMEKLKDESSSALWGYRIIPSETLKLFYSMNAMLAEGVRSGSEDNKTTFGD